MEIQNYNRRPDPDAITIDALKDETLLEDEQILFVMKHVVSTFEGGAFNAKPFFEQGGKVVYAPDQFVVTEGVSDNTKKWSIGIQYDDFLVPVCHQGMNRSQVMRLALQGAHDAAFEKLTEEQAHYFQAEQGAAHDRYTTPFVSRTHGTFSGCEPYTMSISLEEGLPIEEVYAADEDMFMMSPFVMGWATKVKN